MTSLGTWRLVIPLLESTMASEGRDKYTSCSNKCI
jgi:hypothetical protein